MKQWKTISKKTILDHSKYLRVEEHVIELPDGKIMDRWSWVVSPDFVLVLPVTKDGSFLCFRQTKYAIEGTSYAPIGGYIETGEDPLTAAKRELREEMGCEAGEFISLGVYPADGNHGGGSGHLFIAPGVRKVAEPIIDDLEEMHPVTLSPDEAEQALLQGEFKVLGWAAMMGMALLYLKKNAGWRM